MERGKKITLFPKGNPQSCLEGRSHLIEVLLGTDPIPCFPCLHFSLLAAVVPRKSRHIGGRKYGYFFDFYNLMCAYPKAEITLHSGQTQEVYSGHQDTNYIIIQEIPVKQTSNLVSYLPHRLPVNSQANHIPGSQDHGSGLYPRCLYPQIHATLSFKHYFCAIPDFWSSADILLLNITQACLLSQPNQIHFTF